MSLQTLQDLIIRAASRDIPRAAVTRETHLIDDLGLKSMELIALVAMCEETFGVELIEHSDLMKSIATVGDALEFIARLQRESSARSVDLVA